MALTWRTGPILQKAPGPFGADFHSEFSAYSQLNLVNIRVVCDLYELE
jgi:hypothetical protein